MAICKICGAEIEFVRTVKGGLMPVDSERLNHDDLEEGEIIITPGGNTIRVASCIRMPNVTGYRPHWPSCTNPDSIRRRK